MAFQMGVTIAIFAYIGKYIDDQQGTVKPYWTMGFALLGVFAALYYLIKDVMKN
jgi:F0F1-type ATP synthase assembly protein I